MYRLWLVAALAAAGPASASGPEVWAALYDGRLMQSADRDPGAAMGVYETVLRHLPDDDPIRADLLYWMGRAAFEAGDEIEAIDSLRESVRARPQNTEARILLGHIQVERNRIETLPYQESFGTGTGAWVRGWERGQESDLFVSDVGSSMGDALTWALDIREGESDFIMLPFDELRRGPQRIRLLLRADQFPAHVRILLEDADGKRWTAPVIEVSANTWYPVNLSVHSFVPAEAPAARQQVNPSKVRSIILRDVSAIHGLARGENALHIDDVDIR